jgi:phosphoglycerol transferase MdoB-like AlkP superfamily enzyme
MIKAEPIRKGECSMLKGRKSWLAGLMVGLITLMATPAFARSISLKDAGVALWIFIIIGVVIVLLQLIPAAILFFSFIGTSSGMVFKRKKESKEVAAEEKGILHGIEPAPVEK